MLVILGGCLILMAPSPVAADSAHAAAAPNAPVIFLHYDYMVSTDPANPHSDAPNARSIELLVDLFRRHGITLVIDPHHNALPHATWLGFDYDGEGCAQVFAHERGGTAASFRQLKAQYFRPHGNVPWHYVIFGHAGAIMSPDCQFTTGQAELPGYDFMVTVGAELYDPAFITTPFCRDAFTDLCLHLEAGALLHELGHNLDLRHGGADDENFKPNYLSVMNYAFQVGIYFAPSPGGMTVDHWGLDYSDREYPILDENHLDERVGLGGLPDDTHLSLYGNRVCGSDARPAPATGPIDWNCNGVIEADVALDVNTEFWMNPETWGSEGGTLRRLTGYDDWAHIQQYLRTPAYVTGRVPRGRAVP
jgi:hypothetical protein